MARRSKDGGGRFIAEFELAVTPHSAKVIEKRLEAGRMVYNALLGEALKRLDLYQQSRLYQRARRIPTRTEEQRRARSEAFKAAREAWNWSEVDLTAHLQTFGRQFTLTWLNLHVDSQIVKKMAERAARTVVAYSFRQRGLPRFKRRGTLMSLEGINNRQSIMVKTNDAGGLYVDWGAGRGSERLRIPLIIDPDDPYHRHALMAMRPEDGFPGLKYTRIVRKVIRGRDRYYAQVVLVGQPLQRDQLQRYGVVGLDIGPSTIAIVSEEGVRFDQFCGELESKEREIRQLRRRLDRQRRANNPDCYDERGRWIKGRRARNVSGRMRRTLRRLQAIQQRQRDHRKSLHGHLVRQVLRMGSEIRMEALSYKAFQRMFGRSVLARAPGLFVSHLKRKAGEIGVEVTEFSPYKTRLSQTCICGAVRKKKLAERRHVCSCGVRAHRDVFSAYLARFVDGEQLNIDRAAQEWPRFEAMMTTV